MQRAILSFLVSFILLMVVIALGRVSYDNAAKYTQEAEESREVIKEFALIDIGLRTAEIYSATGSDIYRLNKGETDSLPHVMERLRHAVRKDALQKRRYDSIQTLITRHLPVLRKENLTDLVNTPESWRLVELKKAHEMVRRGLDNEEAKLKAQRAELERTNKQNNLLTLMLAALAVAIITWTFVTHVFLSKKSERLEGFLESVLNTSQNAILHGRAVRQRRKVVDFVLEFANPAGTGLLRGDPQQFVGKRWSDVPALKNSTLFPVCVQVVETGEAQDLEYLDSDGTTERWFAVSLAKMGDGVTLSGYETTAIKTAETELKKNIAALKTSNSELEEYAYAASHDLQEPLRKIRTFGGFLRESQKERLDERGNEQLEKIMQSAERMTLLIKDLLSFSGLKEEERFVPTELEEVLSGVKVDLEVAIAQRGATITHDPLPEIDAIPVQMTQLFYNLLSNSLKFAKEDLPLQVAIRCRTVYAADVADIPGLVPNEPYYEITVSDNGIGFNPDYAAQIFGLFKRLNDKERYRGSGIGLALCKKVVTNHGGVIAANGKEGLGAQFYIYLPPTQKGVVGQPFE